jgi:hypothetical protein
MELPRKVAVAGGVAVAAAAAAVAADRAVFVVDDAMLQAVDTLKYTRARAEHTERQNSKVGKHACETLFFDRKIDLILPHSPSESTSAGQATHTRARTRTRATTRESGGVNQRPLLPSM